MKRSSVEFARTIVPIRIQRLPMITPTNEQRLMHALYGTLNEA
jgi:hypothetical protein